MCKVSGQRKFLAREVNTSSSVSSKILFSCSVIMILKYKIAVLREHFKEEASAGTGAEIT